MSLPRITRKRWLVQLSLTLALFLIPFVTVGGNPLLRMDITLRTFFMGGVAIRIDQFYLVLLATLFGVAGFLLLTLVLGRVWCGWLCPQTVFNDLADEIGRRLSKIVPATAAALAEHITALLITTLFSFNLLCWFLAPKQVAISLLHPVQNPVAAASFLLCALGGYLNLLLVKRSFCRSYCPYGRFQAALLDAGTLNLSFLEETADRCLKCGACVRTCPMGIDIRKGFQIECINCGRCIDACRGVMERRPGGFGLIDYRFGAEKGGRPRLGAKTLILLALTTILGLSLVWSVTDRHQTAFAVQRIATAEPRTTADGYQLQPWKAVIGNRSESEVVYNITVAPASAAEVSLLGPVTEIRIAPNEHREITFLIRLKQGRPASAGPVELLLRNSAGQAAKVSLTP